MKRFIKFCDFLGFSPKLHVNKQEIYKTTVTGLLSIIVILISAMCVGYFGSELFLKSTPLVVVSRDVNEDFGPLEVSNKGFLFLLGMQDQSGVFYIDRTIFSVEAIEETLISKIENGTAIQLYESKNLTVGLCSEFYKDQDIEEKNIKIPLASVYCIKPGESKIKGYWGKDTYSTVKMTFKKCSNSTSQNICKSEEEIYKAIQNGYISMDFSYFIVDQKNYSSPMKKIFFDDYNLLNSDSSLFYRFHIDPIKFVTDDGLLFQNNVPQYGWALSSKIILQNVKSDDIISIAFQGVSESAVYLRSYIKIQTVLTQIGGFYQAIMIIANLLSNLFSKNYYFTDVFFNILSANPLVEEVKVDSQIMMSLQNLNIKENSLNNQDNNKIKENNNEIKENIISFKNKVITHKKNANLSDNKYILTTKENETKKNLKVLKSSNRLKMLGSYVFNYLIFCKIWKNKSLEFKYLDTLNNFYKKITSIDTISYKFFEVELLKRTQMETKSSEDNKLYNQIFYSTLSELENFRLDCPEVFSLEKHVSYSRSQI
jgi:hypothetical protein